MAKRKKGEKKTIPAAKANPKHLPKEDENLLKAVTAKRKPNATNLWSAELTIIQRNDLRDFLKESGYTSSEVFLFLVDLFHSILLCISYIPCSF